MKVEEKVEAFNRLSTEVQNFSKKLFSSESIFNSIREEFKGFQIMYSDLKFRPPFLFIGMNPGAGFYNSEERKYVMNFDPLKKMDYCNENYKLANETRHMFEQYKLGTNILEECVKTNFYFISTSGEPHLNAVIKKLHLLDFEKKSKEWNLRLINIIEPKMIICESLYAFKKVIEDKNLKPEYFENTMKAKWGDINIIGYKRHGSRILNKKETAELLNLNS